MGNQIDVITWSIAIIFVFTGIATLLAIVGRNGKTVLTIKEPYLKYLFGALLLEVVAMGLAVGSDAFDSAEEVAAADISSEWVDTSFHWVDEPSGLCESDLAHGDDDVPLFLAVDDEEPKVFVLREEPKREGGMVVLKSHGFVDDEGEKIHPDDLEGICYDGTDFYYAVTSHRRTKVKKVDERRLLKFRMDPMEWRERNHDIVVEESIDLTSNASNLREITGVSESAWNDKDSTNAEFPYALNIEGIAYRKGSLLFGLKNVTTEGDKRAPLLLSYDLKSRQFRDVSPVVPWEGVRGITSLHYNAAVDKLIVVTNPPEKPKFGDSEIYIGTFDDNGFTFDGGGHPLGVKDAKLEGLAVLGDKLFLAYDGPESCLQVRPMSELPDRFRP